jgi:hypothetical protein
MHVRHLGRSGPQISTHRSQVGKTAIDDVPGEAVTRGPALVARPTPTKRPV